jgi:alkaline phosphatase D
MAELLPLDRRRLLQLAAAGAAAAATGAFAQPRLGADPFALGVASGSPGPDSIVLWTRLVHESLGTAPYGVRWEIAHDEGFARIARSGDAPALPQLAHSVHVEVQGLQPDRGYFYRFIAGDWTSPVGRTRTLPAPDAANTRLRIAYASCQRWEHGFFSAWRHMRAYEPDFVLFLGDYIYAYPGAANAVRGGARGWVHTLQDYRARYALYKSDADLRAMHAACPWFCTWDDHEVQNDYAGLQAGNAGPEVADFGARRAAAYQAYYEHMPLPVSVLTRGIEGLAGGAEVRLYGARRIGQLATLYLLDARQYRDAQVCTAGGRTGSSPVNPALCPAWDDPRRSMLGAAQEAWLQGALAGGSAGWNVIGQSTLFGPRNFARAPVRQYWNDGWDGYAAARARVVQALRQERAANPVLLGGDVHENWVGHVKADYARPASENVAVEFCGTSITSRAGAPEAVPGWLAENPHFVFADGTRRGYGLADFTPSQLSVRLRAVDAVERADSGVSTLAQFAVSAGRSRIERD